MENMSLRLVGSSPLLVNAPTTINPLNKETKLIKEISNKRKKSDSEVMELLRLKFEAALYYDEELGPYLPSYNCFKCGQEGARLSKQGKNWERGVDVVGDKSKIDYRGPRTPSELWSSPKFVDIRDASLGGKRVTVARPVFKEWSIDVSFSIAEDVTNPADILANIVTGGRLIGVGTYRARFGRFTVELLNSSVNLKKVCDGLGIVCHQ